MADLPDLPAGVYRHYKGPLYLVLGYGHDANADALHTGPPHMNCRPLGERAVVVYLGLELTEAHTGPRLAVRTAEDFHAQVCAHPGCPRYGDPFEPDAFGGCVRCKEPPVSRFAYVGPEWGG